ncbi:hypothetical protein PAXRUDRAFT_826350 [Paxillus rubicundulus Ve08.2h10]|uniref:Uncharacterized protein n=1 Tax=Paxillus rubicundulus Ve08.2h10 TaxID=930991 RepID=A0A0D0E4H0_9AGAM|nr:hypothetical protein PAXRUDRAFT_826350 [Paxillus rubicundulus Ve08.2h10]
MTPRTNKESRNWRLYFDWQAECVWSHLPSQPICLKRPVVRMAQEVAFFVAHPPITDLHLWTGADPRTGMLSARCLG